MLSKGKIKHDKSPEQARASLMRLCARAEKSSGDALRLMKGWGIPETMQRVILDDLMKTRFIDDERYAQAFVREKTRLGGWGKYKIRNALRLKGISAQTISDALACIDENQTAERLRAQLQRKAGSIGYSTRFELKTKLVRYGLSLGHDYEKVIKEASEIAGAEEEAELF